MIDLQAEYAQRVSEKTDIAWHLPALYAAVAEREKPVVVELGTKEGNSTAALLAAAEAADGQVWSVDIDPGLDPSGFPWHSHPRWHYTCGDSISAEVLGCLPGRVDVLFVDTAHTYVQTYAELQAWVPRVRRGGIVLLHDTQFALLDGWLEHDLGRPEGVVARALSAFCAEAGLSWENRPGSFGLGIIRL